MKTKLVLWGTKGSEENISKVLLALELNPITNKVSTWLFEGALASEEFSKALIDQWRKGEAVAFPEGVEKKEEALSASGSLLPEGIQTEKLELLNRTQTEWIFIVLSTKLYQTYQVELDELQEKVTALNTYSKDMWETMKSFWDKVQAQVSEQNLFREHTNTLRSRTNEIFGQLKKMRSSEDAVFEKEATTNFDKIVEKLKPLEALVEKEGTDLHKLFEQLKSLQQEFKNSKLTRALRSKLWDRIDAAFKSVKLKRSPNSSPDNRLARRMEGLQAAIGKMEKSIGRDKKDLGAQNEKINSGDVSQLETQLREVRAKLIQERIDSKNKKLADMLKTLKELEARNAKNIAYQAKEEKKAAEKKAKEAAAAEKKKQAAVEAKPKEEPKEETKTTVAETVVVEEVKVEALPEPKEVVITENLDSEENLEEIGKDEEE